MQQNATNHKTIASILAHNAAHYGNDIWLVCAETGTSYSWQEAYDRACQIAKGLIAHGVKAGQSVAVAAPNSIGGCLAFIGIVLAGGRATPMNLVAGPTVMAFVLSHSKTEFLIVDESCQEALEAAMGQVEHKVNFLGLDRKNGPVLPESTLSDNDEAPPLPEIAPHHPALLMYTSGTTGNPKGVVLSHHNMIAAGQNVMMAHEISQQDSTLCVLPIYHINAMCVSVMGTIVSASELVIPYRFSNNSFWQQLYDFNCSWFSAVPTLFAYMLNNEVVPSLRKGRLRFARSASAPLPPETHRKFEARFGIPIIETMGLTETGAQILSNPLPPQKRKIGSPGVGFGNEVKIIDPESLVDRPANQEGEIVVRGANVMQGYLDQPEQTAATITKEGWLRTGDLGRMDDDGFVFVTGRIKELIIKGGENIAPREVDEALLSHGAVLEAAAFARPCDNYGQTVEACVMLKSQNGVDLAELMAHCHDRLGAFKSPDKIHILPELPKGPSGKVQRLKLLELVS